MQDESNPSTGRASQEANPPTPEGKLQHKADGTDIASRFGAILGLALAGVFAKSIGLVFTIPAGLVILFAWIFGRIFDNSRKPFVAAVAIQTAHVCWMLIEAISAQSYATLAEAIAYGAGILWLALKPERRPIICLSIYQVLGLVVVAVAFKNYSAADQNGIVIGALLRLSALLTMFVGLKVRTRADYCDLKALKK